MRRLLLLTATLVAIALSAAIARGADPVARPTRGGAIEVRIDLSATRQVIQGFGTSNRVWSDPHVANAANVSVPVDAQRQILTALYRRLGLTRVRSIVDPGVQKTEGGAFNFSGKLGDAHIAFAKQARSFGVKTYFPSPVTLETWMQEDDPAGYVDWAMSVLKYWRANGLELPLFSPLNEPQMNRDFQPRWFHDMVVQLGARLRAAGFKTKLVIPDDVNPAEAYERAVAVLQDPKARQYVGAIAYHTYSENLDDIVRLRQLGTTYSLPVWMTEWNNGSGTDWRKAMGWAERMHLVLTVGGVNAVDYMWGYFGSWDPAQLLSIEFDGGTYRRFAATPAYWLTGQYSRYVRPGSVRVAATPAAGRVLTSAYRDKKRVIVVATNPGDAPENVRITIRNGKLMGVVRPVRSSPTEKWRSLAQLQTRAGSFTASLPPQSVTTFLATQR